MKGLGLAISQLRKIDAQLNVGDVTLAYLARATGITSASLSTQMWKARKQGLLPATTRGHRRSCR